MPGFGMSDEFIVPMLDETPQSIVLFDKDGKRMVTSTAILAAKPRFKRA
jgi:hypothetical protein